MRRIVSLMTASATAVVGVLVVAAVSVAQTQDTTKGAALLAEARKAVGGEDKLAAIKRLQVKGEMRRGQGAVTLEGDSEIFIELPDKFRRNESLTLGPGGPGIDRVEVLNGNDAWEENSGGGGRAGLDAVATSAVVVAVTSQDSAARLVVIRPETPRRPGHRASIPSESENFCVATGRPRWRASSWACC